MKLTDVQLRQFRVFRTGLDALDLDPGITIFHGPNESGKSTLAYAIRTAFFERHGSGTLSDLQPWGDSAAAPEVSLKFEFQGRQHQLVKRFVRQKRCDLTVDGEFLNGDEAEQYLARLMGFTMPARGASRPEHWGVPGLLWIEQGAGHQLQASVLHANEHLQGILNDAMGHIASSDGDRILNAVSDRLDQLLTRTGSPRQDYRKAIEEEQRLSDKLDDMDRMIRTYQQDVDQLAALQRLHERETQEQPWREMREKEQRSRAQLAEVMQMREAQQRERHALSVCKQTQDLLHQQLQAFSEQVENLRKREQELTRERERYQSLSDQTTVLRQTLDVATRNYVQARDALVLSHQAQQRHDKSAQLAQLRDEIRRVREHEEEARKIQASLRADEQHALALQVDAAQLSQLRTLHGQLQSLGIRQQAIATRLRFDLQSGQTVTLDGATVAGKVEHLLLSPARLTIPGVGDVHITPGGDEVSGLARERERLEHAWAACLQTMNVTSLQQAQQRDADHAEVAARIRQHRTVLALHAPEGVTALARRHATLAGRMADVQRDIDALPPVSRPEEELDLVAAQADERRAEQDLKASESQLQAHLLATATAQAELDAAQREYRRANDTLGDPSRRQTEQQALQRLHHERAQEAILSERIDALERQIDAVQPAILEQDIMRYAQSAARSHEAYAERERTIREFKGRLQALGTQGLEEQRDALAGQLAASRRRVGEFSRNAQALGLLQALLQEKRQALTRQLHEPLKRRLMHYLKLLFTATDGDVGVVLGDDLMPVSLTRDNARADLQALSFGAREQMGLISRLAYADLLKDAGQPTLIMLDDALVHSDETRLAHMKRILFDAASRHQILLFTCHPEKWRDMGVAPRAIRSLIL